MKKIIYALAVVMLLSANTSANSYNTASASEKIKTATASPVKTASPKPVETIIGNYPNKVEIVFSDIDGTLVPFHDNFKGEVPESAKIAVKKLKDAKIPLVLATGRVFYETNIISKNMGNSNGYIITHQGAEIRDPNGKIIYRDTILNSKDVINKIESIKKEHDFNSNIVVFFNGRLYSTTHFKLPYNWAPVTVLKSYDELGKGFDLSAICVYEPDIEKLKIIQSELKKEYPSYRIDISANCYCDVTNTTATKGNAIRKLSEMLGINLKNAAVFGDAENDVSMFKEIKSKDGLTVAVGNAMPKLKENSDYVTTSVTEGGESHAIDMILQNNKLLDKSPAAIVK